MTTPIRPHPCSTLARAALGALLLVAGCTSAPGPSPAPRAAASDTASPASAPEAASAPAAAAPALAEAELPLPTGRRLDPTGARTDLGSLPLSIALAPGGREAVVLLSGWRDQGLQVVDRASGRVVQTVVQPAAFLGLAFAPDGRTLYASGGNQDVVYRYDWNGGRATLRDSLRLAPPTTVRGTAPGEPRTRTQRRQLGVRYPAGIALSPDGRRLYVAENIADSLAVVDVASGGVVQRLATGRYPYGVAAAADGTVYVSAWGGHTVSVFAPAAGGALRDEGRILVGRHPSALLLGAGGSRLFVASATTDRVVVVDTRARRVLTELLDPPPAGPGEGSTPNALALSPDGTRLFIAEADVNAVAVFDLSPRTSGTGSGPGTDRLAGRLPVDWYPTAVGVSGDTLLVVCGKGTRTGPNPSNAQPGEARPRDSRSYTLGQLSGTLRTIATGASADSATLAGYARRVAAANGWDRRHSAGATYPPFEHVVYIIKENRTFDQVFGDVPEGDGDSALVFFPRTVSPNHHALADRFGLYDRFLVNAEVSADGHNWSTAAYATDYLEKTVESNYSGRRAPYDYEGTNRGVVPQLDEDVAEPANGYIWDLANRAGITFRNYGEFVVPDDVDADDRMPAGYRGAKPFLAAHTNRDFAGFDLAIPDQRRADIFIDELHGFERAGRMPQLVVMRLPNDHTAGGRPGEPTPRAYMADNDLALGRVVEAISHSRFWPRTVVFVVEDDAQNGPDHVDSHRAPFLVISPYSRPGVNHRFANTTDVIATISEILGLGSLSQFDYYGHPLRDVFTATPDARPYDALRPGVPLDERNAASNPGARDSRRLDLRFEDSSDDDLFNRILWDVVKGKDTPYPGTHRMSTLEWQRAH